MMIELTAIDDLLSSIEETILIQKTSHLCI